MPDGSTTGACAASRMNGMTMTNRDSEIKTIIRIFGRFFHIFPSLKRRGGAKRRGGQLGDFAQEAWGSRLQGRSMSAHNSFSAELTTPSAPRFAQRIHPSFSRRGKITSSQFLYATTKRRRNGNRTFPSDRGGYRARIRFKYSSRNRSRSDSVASASRNGRNPVPLYHSTIASAFARTCRYSVSQTSTRV